MNRLLTEDIASQICDAIFDSDTKETLKLTKADRTEITLNKQFYNFFKRTYLKYDIEETIIKALNIFEYAKQDVIKFKLSKAKLDELNNPISFFNTNTSSITGNTTNSAINSSVADNTNKSAQLNYVRADATNINTTNAIGRAGASQLNEDYKNLEASGKKEDEKYDQITNKAVRNTFDIKLPTDLENINLSEVITQSEDIKLDKAIVPEQAESQDLEISYTGVNVNKSLSASTAISSNSSKSLNKSLSKATNINNALNTNIGTTKNNTVNLGFIYGDATYKALGLYVTNFRESFFNSFSSLFISPGTGY